MVLTVALFLYTATCPKGIVYHASQAAPCDSNIYGVALEQLCIYV